MAGLIDFSSLVSPIAGILGKLIPDKAAAAAAAAQLQELTTTGELQQEFQQLLAVTTAQTDVNKVEAASSSVFIAGWRPFVGWVCGVGLAMSCVVSPLFTWASTMAGHPAQFPKLDDPLLQSTLAGMLGLGYGLRTFEKFKGVAGSH